MSDKMEFLRPMPASSTLKGKERRMLNPQVDDFIGYYVKYGKPRKAAIKAGWSPNYAGKKAAELMADPEVLAEINRRMHKRHEKFRVTEKQLQDEMAIIAMGDIRDLFNDDGTVRPMSEWTAEATKLVGGIDVTERRTKVDDKEVVTVTHKIKLHDRANMLLQIGRTLGIFVKDNQHFVNVAELSDAELNALIKRASIEGS